MLLLVYTGCLAVSWKWQRATDETKCVIAAGLSEDKSVWSQTGSLAPASLGSCFDPRLAAAPCTRPRVKTCLMCVLYIHYLYWDTGIQAQLNIIHIPGQITEAALWMTPKCGEQRSNTRIQPRKHTDAEVMI